MDQRDVNFFSYIIQSKALPLLTRDHGLIVIDEVNAKGGVCSMKEGAVWLVGLEEA